MTAAEIKSTPPTPAQGVSNSRHGESPPPPAFDFAAVSLAGPARFALEREILARRDLRAVDRAILAALFERFRGKAACWPGNESLAVESGCSARTVRRVLNRLE